MKATLVFFLLLLAVGAHAQSNSYQTLKDTFIDQPDVHSFSVGGWVGRLVLNIAGEQEFKEAIRELRHVRLITIPKAEFNARKLTVGGFKKSVLKQDSYEELAFIRDNNEEVSIYVKEGKNRSNHYFVLIEDDSEVVAVELKGYLDPKLLNIKNTTLAIQGK